MYKHSAIDFDGPCYTFIKKASDPLDKVQLPEHLEFASLDAEKDTAIVREKNKVTYEYEYVKDCIRLSTAIRTKDTGDLAAWTMTHRDCKFSLVFCYKVLTICTYSHCWCATCFT